MSGSQALAGPDVSTKESFLLLLLLLVSSLSPNAGGAGQKKEANRESQHHLHCWMPTPFCDYHSSPAVRLNMADWMSRNARWGQSTDSHSGRSFVLCPRESDVQRRATPRILSIVTAN